MPVYYFHLRDGADVLLDPDGREVGDPNDVVGLALREARSIICADAMTGVIRMDQRIDVEDESSQLVHRLEFRDAVQIIGAEDIGAN
jgi:hypothetical protein